MLAAPPEDFTAFAISGLERYEAAFERFFVQYEAYQRASGEWDQLYGALYGRSQPGWVAIYGNGPMEAEPQITEQVIDPATGIAVPVVPVDEGNARTPVVQPVASEQGE